MNTTEIAVLILSTPASVEVTRAKIRKKLGLDHCKNLTGYGSGIEIALLPRRYPENALNGGNPFRVAAGERGSIPAIFNQLSVIVLIVI